MKEEGLERREIEREWMLGYGTERGEGYGVRGLLGLGPVVGFGWALVWA